MGRRVLPAKAGTSHAAGSHEPDRASQVSELTAGTAHAALGAGRRRRCKACDLYKRGTQTVFGEGPRKAEVMLVGEQPGDAEDLAGHPSSVRRASCSTRALDEAGIDRRQVYVTNVVKHFKWEPRGKRRIHAKPNARRSAPAGRGSRRRSRW
jgi:DNA polymerase